MQHQINYLSIHIAGNTLSIQLLQLYHLYLGTVPITKLNEPMVAYLVPIEARSIIQRKHSRT